MKPSSMNVVVAHARKVREITITALRRAMGLTGCCEVCGASTKCVIFNPDGTVTEVCSPCLSQANRSIGEGT